jgi:hypothetical protein
VDGLGWDGTESVCATRERKDERANRDERWDEDETHSNGMGCGQSDVWKGKVTRTKEGGSRYSEVRADRMGKMRRSAG